MIDESVRAPLRRDLVHRCIDCGRRFEHGFTPRCPGCNGLVDVQYDLDSVSFRESDVALERFVELLPVRDASSLLPLGEGATPCLHAGTLGESLGLSRLFLKVESRNPTGTTKDRMAAAVLSMFNELGVREFVSTSTGNSSSSLAHGIGLHPRFTMHLYMGGAFQHRVRHAENNERVVSHVLEGLSFSDTFNHARNEAKRLSLPFEAGFFNPARREGLKLAFFEAVEQIPGSIHWYFQAVSSAMGVYGTWKGAQELLALGAISALPRLVGVQQESCCPMVRAFEEDSPEIRPHHIFLNPTGIAEAILRGNPSGCYPYVYSIVKASEGALVSVSEAEIVEAGERLSELEGVECGHCGAATVAAVTRLAAQGKIPRNDTILLNLTD